MNQAIINMCDAVLACDGVKEGTKAWARDLRTRAGGASFADFLRGFGGTRH